ncbi:MAG: hypothetical protein GTO03_17270, partial [Planctomycetales bacterium]|nr:hypothetical protein [Planctomycetales bacterium]
MASRSMVMRLEEVDWSGKDVLDLGCNLGVTGWEFARRGARRVVGVDLPHVAQVARELANWVGWWNVDVLGLRLPAERERIVELSGLEGFDVVLALSVDRQIGYAPWMAELCREVFFLEGHVPDKEETYRERLEADFKRVEFLGATRDHGPRPVFRCWVN